MKKSITLLFTLFYCCLFFVSLNAQESSFQKKLIWSLRLEAGISEIERNEVLASYNYNNGGEVSDGKYVAGGVELDYAVNSFSFIYSGLALSFVNASIREINALVIDGDFSCVLANNKVSPSFKVFNLVLPVGAKLVLFNKLSLSSGILISKPIVNRSVEDVMNINEFGKPNSFIYHQEEGELELDLLKQKIQYSVNFALGYIININNFKKLSFGFKYQYYLNRNQLAYQTALTEHFGVYTSLSL